MAQPIPCDICRSTTADFVITFPADGRVIGVGVECLLDWALPIAEAYAQAVAREQGEPGTVDVTALDPPDVVPAADRPAAEELARTYGTDPETELMVAAEDPQDGQEGRGDTDADWEASARPAAPRGRKRGAGAKAAGGREDPEPSPAAHVDG